MKASGRISGGGEKRRAAKAKTGTGSRKRTDLKNEIARLQAMTCELQETAENLRRSLEISSADGISKSQFLASMSHELRTPLNAIIGFSEILKDEILGPIGSERYRDYATSIHKSGSYLLGLVNELLDFSKLDAGKLELIDEALDVGKIVGDCIHLLEPQAHKAKVDLRAAPMAKRYLLKADERRLRQILLNLLSNAVKFTPAGGEVTVSAAPNGQGFAISVADNGIGIAPEDIPRALERFGQIDSALSRKHEGTGLGLPLAKHLAELHGAEFAIESEVGVGTTVTVTFPPGRVLGELGAA
jgi:signal transduction histidine kinase